MALVDSVTMPGEEYTVPRQLTGMPVTLHTQGHLKLGICFIQIIAQLQHFRVVQFSSTKNTDFAMTLSPRPDSESQSLLEPLQ